MTDSDNKSTRAPAAGGRPPSPLDPARPVAQEPARTPPLLDALDTATAAAQPRTLLVPSPGLLAATQTALTDFICLAQNHDGTHTNSLARALVMYSATALRWRALVLPAPFPQLEELDAAGLVSGHGAGPARRQLGWSEDDLEDRYEQSYDDYDIERRFEPDTLRLFFDEEFWTAAAAVIDDGPSVAKRRMERALNRFGRTPSKLTGNRPTSGSLSNYRSAFLRFLSVVVELADDGHPCPELAAWTDVPRDLKLPRAPSRRREPETAPGHTVRHVYARLNAITAGKLRCELGDHSAERAAVRRLTRDELLNIGLFRLLIRRAALVLLCCVGFRATAACQLTEEQLEIEHMDADGNVGPALKAFERKRKDRHEWVWKCIPEDMAECLLVTVEFRRRWAQARHGVTLQADSPLLLTGGLGPFERVSLRAMFAGMAPRSGGGGIPALLPRETGNRYEGWGPQACRRRARQWVATGDGQKWLEARGFTEEKVAWCAESLLGHSDRDVRRIYGGAASTADIERLAKLGAQLTWAMLTTDLGARKDWDRDELTWAFSTVKACETKLDVIAAARARYPREREALYRNKRAAKEAGDAVRREELEDEIEALHYAEQSEVGGELEAKLKLQRAKDRLKFLTSDRGMRLIDDTVPARAHTDPDPDEPERIRAEVCAGTRVPGAAASAKEQRCYLAAYELAELEGLADSTVRAFLRNGFAASRTAPPLWQPSAGPPLTSWSSARRQALLVQGLNPELATFTDLRRLERLRAVLATPYPDRWGRAFARLANIP